MCDGRVLEKGRRAGRQALLSKYLKQLRYLHDSALGAERPSTCLIYEALTVGVHGHCSRSSSRQLSVAMWVHLGSRDGFSGSIPRADDVSAMKSRQMPPDRHTQLQQMVKPCPSDWRWRALLPRSGGGLDAFRPLTTFNLSLMPPRARDVVSLT